MFSTPVSIKILVMYDIINLVSQMQSLLCARTISSIQTTLMDRLALRRTSPIAHLVDDLLVMIVRLMQFCRGP
jgi:hypothetical protein